MVHNTTYIVHASGDVEVHNAIEFLESFTTKTPKTVTPRSRMSVTTLTAPHHLTHFVLC